MIATTDIDAVLDAVEFRTIPRPVALVLDNGDRVQANVVIRDIRVSGYGTDNDAAVADLRAHLEFNLEHNGRLA